MSTAEILAEAGVTREWAGQWVRREWDAWAAEQPDTADHPSWRTPWTALDERDREVDRRIGEQLFAAGWRAARGQQIAPLRIGDMLYGFCGGAFGRDSYGDKRVEAIGADWVVCRVVTCEEGLAFYSGDLDDLCGYRYPLCEQCDYQGPPADDGSCTRCGGGLPL